MSDLKIQGEVSFDTTSADQALGNVEQRANRMAQNVGQAGEKAGKAVSSIGDGGQQSSQKVDSATRSMVNSIQRATAAMEAGSKAGAQYYEALASQRGVSLDALRPYLAQLEAVQAKQLQAAASQEEMARAQRESAQAVAEQIRANAAASASQQQFLAGLREQIALYGKSADEIARYRAAQLGIGSEAAPLLTQLRNQKAAQDLAAQAARDEAQAQRDAAQAKKQAESSQQSFLKGLREQSDLLGKSQADVLRYKAAQLGVSKDAEAYIAQIEKAGTATGKMGVSAAQTAAALRGVPAQFTDIVTSLQAGQAPLTVLLQQGGQLKDMFGGVGAAAAALGRYVVGLINPYTLLAAAAAVLAVAYYEGSKESEAFNKSLVLTGNYAGQTADSFTATAKAIAGTSTSIGTAREALQSLVSTGKFSGEALRLAGEDAVRMADLSGKSIEKVVDDLAGMTGGVAKWAAEHNQSMHYLTLAQYDYIKSLEETGKTEQAVIENLKALHASLGTTGAQNLGYLESAWKSLTSAISGAWNAAKSFGRDASVGDKLSQIGDKTAFLQQQIDDRKARGLNTDRYDAALRAAQQEQAALQEVQRLQQKQAETQARQGLANEKAIKASDFIDKLEDGVSKTARMNKELREYRQNLEAIRAVNPDDDRVSASRVAATEASIRKKYEDKSGASALQNMLNGELAVWDGYSKQRDEILKGEEKSLDSMRKRGVINEQEYVTQLFQVKDNALIDQIAIAEKEAEIAGGKKELAAKQKFLGQIGKLETERLNNRQAYNDALGELDAKAAREYADASLKSYDSTSKETEAIRIKLQAAQDEYASMGMTAQQIGEVARARGYEAAAARDAKASIAELIPGREEEAASLREQAKLLRDLADQQVVNGARKDFVESWKKGAEEINRSLTDALLRGFESGKSFGKNLVDTLRNMFNTLILRPVISAVLAPVGGAVSTGLGALGIPSTAQAGSSASLLGTASNLQGAYSALTGSVGAGLFGSSAAYAAAVPGLTSFGAGSQAAMLAAQTGEFGSAGLAATAGAGGAGTGATSMMAAMGPAAAAAGGIVAGYGLGSMISGNFSAIGNNQAYATGGGTAAGAAIGTAILPGIGTAIGALIGGVAGGLVNRAFGMGPKKYGDKGFEGEVTADGFDGRAFADWSQKGGWFRRGRNGTDYAAVDQSTLDGVNAQFFGMAGAYQALGRASGITGDLGSFRYSMRDDWGSAENIAKSFGKLSDALGAHLVPGIEGFRKEGEQLLDTATRLTGVFAATNQIAMVFGKDVVGVFGSVGLASTNMRQQLVDAAGGLDAFTSQLTAYYETYYTEEEKLQRLRKTLGDQFAGLGMAMPDSKDAFRVLVEGLDLTTNSGRQAYTALMSMAPSFATLVDGLDQAKQAMAAFAKQVADFQQSLRLGDLSTLTPEQQYAEAKRQYDATSAAAVSGDSTAQSQWTQIAQAFLEASRSFFASGGQYAADFAAVQGFRPNGSHANGLAYVPFDGYLAELHQGERVLTRAENVNYNGPDWSKYGRGESVALVAEIRALSAQVAALKETVRQVEQAKEAQAEARHAEALAVQAKQVRLQQQLVDK